jgi:hypothetical protein
MNKEFLRMQQLAGVKPAQDNYNEIIGILTEVYLYNHYYSKGILKEEINEINLKSIASKIKDKFSKLPAKAQQVTKKVVDSIKKTGFNPTEILGDLSKVNKRNVDQFFQTLRATQTLNLANKLQEAEEGNVQEFTDFNQLKNLKPGDKFVWKGKANSKVKWNGGDIVIDAGKKQFGLKPNMEYIVQPPVDYKLGGPEPDVEEYTYTAPAEIWANKEVDYIAKQGEKNFGNKIMKFFRFVGNKLGGKKALAFLTAAMTLSNASAGTVGLFTDADVTGMYGPSGALANPDDTGVQDFTDQDSQDADKSSGEEGTEIDQNIPTSGTPYNTEIDDSEVVRGLDQNGVDTQGLEVTDNTATTQTYETGEGTLDDAGLEKSANELAEKTIDDLNDQLESNKGENLTKITLKIKYGAAVSHNQGDDSNVSNSGGDLLDQRLDSSEKVAKLAAQKVQDAIEKTYGSGITVDISFAEVDTHNGIDDQKVQNAQDFLETQSSFQSSETDIDTSEKGGEPIKLVYSQFVVDPDKLGFNASEKSKAKGATPTDSKTKKEKPTSDTTSNAAPVTQTPAQTKQDVSTLNKFNRNSQIGLVLARISDKSNIWRQLGDNKVSNLTDTILTGIINGKYKNAQGEITTSEEAKKIARLIINIRKSPDTLLKKISKSLDVDLQPRAKAIATKPGTTTRAQTQTVTEFKLINILNEAMVDDVFQELGITDDIIQASKVRLLALLGSMYAAEGDNTLSILDSSKLNDAEKKELQGLGFIAQPGGNYVFLGKGETKSQFFDKLQDKNKTQPDVDRISKTINTRSSIKSLLKRIDTVIEFRDLVLAIFNQNNEFLDPEYKKDKNKIKSVFFNLRNRIQEVEAKDVSATVKAILNDTTLKSQLQRINTVEEAIQLILRDIIPYLSDKLRNGDEGKRNLKNAIIQAANEYSKLNK